MSNDPSNISDSPDSTTYYESDKAVADYLMFHYGTEDEVLPYDFGPHQSLDYAVRCVSQCLDISRLPSPSRALDLGCAVGRSTFELSRHCAEVIGVDTSHRFIETAETIRVNASTAFSYTVEGTITRPSTARLPEGVHPDRVRFVRGDAMALPDDFTGFDVVLMANLIDRLPDPARCLRQWITKVNVGGQLIIASPYTWLEAYTPKENWLGGNSRQDTFSALEAVLGDTFELLQRRDLPFLIREHARKYQWSVAEATVWLRK